MRPDPQPEFEWVGSVEILREYMEVLARPKFALPRDLLRRWARLLETVTTRVEVLEPFEFPRDQKDAKFLACALSSGADFLITGDRDFEQAQRLLKTTMVSVAMFEKNVCRVWARS